jgi:alkanesulfonate monooxygenase SsuD/methylene tetrahydromethanopterin reductase-like flavin-dependent oxidoreductase (luciferase family)
VRDLEKKGAMKFGLSFLPDHSPATMSARDYFDHALRLCEIADRGGLGYVKITEHYLHPYGGYCPSPLIFLGAVAQRTSRIRLLTGGILPVFSHPIKIAAEASMVDALSNGRLELGFARAYLPYEFDAFGIELDGSRQRYRDIILAVVDLWAKEKATARSPHFSYENASSLPRPTQLPGPPVWATAVRSRESFAWIGEQGFGLLVTGGFSPLEDLRSDVEIYREAFAESHTGSGSGAAKTALSIPLFLCEDGSNAITEGDYYVQEYLRIWGDAASAWDLRTSRDYLGYERVGRFIRQAKAADLRAAGTVVVGVPEQTIDLIRNIIKTLNPSCILWQIDFGAMPSDKAHRTLNLFLARVLPFLAD